MSAVAELTETLIAGGMTPAAAAALLARAAVEMNSTSISKAALRTRRWREKKASQGVTERHTVTPGSETGIASPTVTDRHKASHGDVPSLSKSLNKERKRERRAEQLSDAWEPKPPDWDFAVSQLGDAATLELQKFKDHARTKGRVAKDWDAAWRNWVRRAVEYRGGTPLPEKSPENNGGWRPGLPTEAELREKYAKISAGEDQTRLSGDQKPEDAGVFREGREVHSGGRDGLCHSTGDAGMGCLDAVFRPSHWGKAGRGSNCDYESRDDKGGTQGGDHCPNAISRMV